jgi:hypothetical protein
MSEGENGIPNGIPDVYTDQFIVSGGPYGMALSFRKSPPEPGPGKVPHTVARVWMSYEHAKMRW